MLKRCRGGAIDDGVVLGESNHDGCGGNCVDDCRDLLPRRQIEGQKIAAVAHSYFVGRCWEVGLLNKLVWIVVKAVAEIAMKTVLYLGRK